MSHTPGPWRVDGTPGYEALEVHAVNRRIAKSLYHMGSEDNEADANARLIAAAPDLLAACEMALSWFNWWASDLDGPPHTHAFEARNAVQAAIAKVNASDNSSNERRT